MLDLRSIHLGQHNIAAFANKRDAIAFAKAGRWTASDVIRCYNRFNIFWIVGQYFVVWRVATRDGGVAEFTIPDRSVA